MVIKRKSAIYSVIALMLCVAVYLLSLIHI